jgi:hypothetical protein
LHPTRRRFTTGRKNFRRQILVRVRTHPADRSLGQCRAS